MPSAPPRAPLAGHQGNDRDPQPRHLVQVRGDGFGLAPFLGTDAGIGAGSIDQGDHRPAEALGLLHQAQRLAVAFRVGHAEVAPDVLLDIAPLLVPQDGHRDGIEEADAADDGRVVGEAAIAVQFHEVAHQIFDEITAGRPLGMAGQPDNVNSGFHGRFISLTRRAAAGAEAVFIRPRSNARDKAGSDVSSGP